MNYNYRKNKIGVLIDDNDKIISILFDNCILISKSTLYPSKFLYRRIINFKSFGFEINKKYIYLNK
jgi:hypothetical protein